MIPGRIVKALTAAFLLLAAGMSQAAAPPADERPAVGASATHELTAADVEPWLSGLMAYGLRNGDIAGAVVSIVKDGRVLFESGYGYADVATRTPMDAGRVMTRIGSTSKLFTWTAVMQLVQEGRLDLNRNVDDYLDFRVSPAGGRPITLQDLMNHRAGFEEGLKDILATDPVGLQSTEQYLKRHPRPLLFPAGTVPAYSNYGAALAGYIVERVSGEPFERYVEHHIFQPLRMEHSTFDQPLPGRFKGMVAQGYRQASLPPSPYELVVTRPAGSVSSTAADMARFMLAHLQQGHLGDYDMLSAQTTQLMHSPSEEVPPGFASMAHGFFHGTRNGHTVIGHGGDTVVFHTELDLLPDDHIGIFYSFNSRGREQAVYGLRQAVLDQFFERYFPQAPAKEPATLASARADAARIAGTYEGSRRVQHGFLSVFYLLQQSTISAAPDGTITAPGMLGGTSTLHEVAPDLWQEVGGTRQLALKTVNGVRTVIDSEDPISWLQAVPARRSSSLNLTVLLGSLVVLALTVVLWPVIALVRRHYRIAPPPSVDARRMRLLLRGAALVTLLWLVWWMGVLQPVLSTQLDVYGPRLDGTIRMLQIGGVLVIALAAAGLLALWRLLRDQEVSWPSRIGSALITLALLGVVWIGFMGGLFRFTLNY